MAVDINAITLVGRLTRDCEVKQLSNTVVCNFSLAVNRRVNQGGNWVDEASFFDVELYGNQAGAIQNYLTKGKQVAVEGALRQHRWQAADGQNRSRVSIVASNVQLLGGSSTGASERGDVGASSQQSNAPQNNVKSSYENTAQNQYGDVQNSSSAGGNFDSTDFQDDIPF